METLFWDERWQQKFNAWNAKHTNILTFKAQILIHMNMLCCPCPVLCSLSSLGVANFPWKLHELQIFAAPFPFPFFHTHEMRPGRRNGTPTFTRSQVACAVDIFMACSELPDGSCRLPLAACHLPQHGENALQYNRICQKRDFNKLLDM